MAVGVEVVGGDVRLDARMWGKERGLPRAYPVVCHLLDAAAVCRVLWDVLLGDPVRARIAGELGLEGAEARRLIAFWAGLHDLGKITPPFQAQVECEFAAVRAEGGYAFAAGAEKERGFRHERATHWALTTLLGEAGYPGARRMAASVSHQVAQLLGGHHGCFGEVLQHGWLGDPSAVQPGLGEEGWAGQRRAHFDEVRRVVGGSAVPRQGLSAEMAVVVCGLVVIADWLASQTQVIASIMPPPGWTGTPEELDAHWERSLRMAPHVVSRARLGRAEFVAEGFGDMFPFPPNALQGDLARGLPPLVEQRGSGLLLVTAPTGDGKTEAALFAASVLGRASGARGLYFALPTMATADAMFPRVASFAEKALGGERALTLLHAMAWLSPVYAPGGEPGTTSAGAGTGGEAEVGEVSSDAGTVIEAGTWLRGRRRGLLAPLGAGTIDQALSGVLPLTHNALRLFGLSDRVFVVDEAHAYGPWMHRLLTRLLEWLGSFRAPVVLLSATLTGRTAASLVNAYRRGAGHYDSVAVEPRYPGWLFTDAATGEVSAARETATGRPRSVDVEIHRVVWDTDAEPSSTPRPGGRRAALRSALRPVADGGGTALVCCTTVAEAQRTFRDLCSAYPDLAAREGGLRLLHSRFPAERRQRITAECEAAYGKPTGEARTPRQASILVATQVVEQSLDFDFDLVVSDLAPLAQLLQRVGRARRHERGVRGRPSWAQPEDRPRLVVLEPVDGGGAFSVPRTWGSVYDPGLLRRTAHLLASRTRQGIAVPGDVQSLVDAVYAEDFVVGLDAAAARELERMDAERAAEEMAENAMADLVGIPPPADIGTNLHLLSRREAGVTEDLLTTRLGADTGRVLCLYEQCAGRLTLDPDGQHPFDLGAFSMPSREQLARLMAQTVPVPGRWLPPGADGEPAPGEWEKQPLLRDLVLVRMRRGIDEAWEGRHGGHLLTLSDVGLEQVT